MLEHFLEKHKRQHSHLAYLRFVKGSIGMMLNPHGTDSVFDIEDGLRQSKSTTELLQFTSSDPDVKRLIDQRYLQPIPDTTALSKLPLGTLGRSYFDHLDTMGFDPDYYRKIDVKTDTDYVMMRIRQTHDIWHVITGFDTHPLGEIAVKAVELAQTHRPMAAAICAGGVFRYMIREPEDFGHCLESIQAGYQMGLHAKALLAVKWEEMWDRKLEDLRDGLGVRVVGPRGGELTVKFGPQSPGIATVDAQAAISEALGELSPLAPDERDSNDSAPDEHQHRSRLDNLDHES